MYPYVSDCCFEITKSVNAGTNHRLHGTNPIHMLRVFFVSHCLRTLLC